MTEKIMVLTQAQRKKKKTQLEGLKILENVLSNLVKNGLGIVKTEYVQQEVTHAITAMGQYYLPGAQWLLHELLLDEPQTDCKLLIKSGEIAAIKKMHALLKHGRTYIEDHLNRQELATSDFTVMEEWLGHAWRFKELESLGLVEEDTEYVQLAFHHEAHEAREDLVDQGYWLCPGKEDVYLTKHYIPMKAKSRVKRQDSCHKVVMPATTCRYPGDLNPRIRWQSATEREINNLDLAAIRKSGQSSLSHLLTKAKKHLTSPLAHPYPAFLWKAHRVGLIDDQVVLEDEHQDRLRVNWPMDKTWPVIRENATIALGGAIKGDALLLLLFYNEQRGEIQACPLSLVNEKHLVRFVT